MLLLIIAALAADTVYSTRIAVAPGESLAVTVSGEGPAIIMLPGLFGSSYSYRHVAERVAAAGYQSVAIEPLGIGSSGRPAESDYSLSAQADRVAAVMDSLGIDSAYALVHSLGASIALRVGYRHPGRIRGLVSIEGGVAEAVMSDGLAAAMRFAPLLRLMNARQMVFRRVMADMKESSFDDDWVTRETVLAYVEGMADEFGATMTAYRRMARTDETERLADHLPTIHFPVRLLVSAMHHVSRMPDEEYERMATLLPDFESDTIPETGFFIHEEQPDAVVARLLQLIETPASTD